MRVIMLLRADKNSEAGVPPTPGNIAAMEKLIGEMAAAGVLLSAEGLYPTSKAIRISVKGGKRTIVDGPFTESKELIAGYMVVQVPSMDEAAAWAMRLSEVEPEFECELRPLYDEAAFSAE